MLNKKYELEAIRETFLEDKTKEEGDTIAKYFFADETRLIGLNNNEINITLDKIERLFKKPIRLRNTK
jgi:uncharacterized protein (UPF0333 family)